MCGINQYSLIVIWVGLTKPHLHTHTQHVYMYAMQCHCICKCLVYTECQCSLLGVVNDGECVTEGDGVHQPGDCYCKANVMGAKCDMCKMGYYNLSAENPDGCEGIDKHIHLSVDHHPLIQWYRNKWGVTRPCIYCCFMN